MYTARFIASALILAWWLLFSDAFAKTTNNYELKAVPVQLEVGIDGRLDDWDLSAEILLCYDTTTLLESHSVRVAAMYDRKGLYFAFRFRDSTPMVNHVDPGLRADEGWKSDAIQLRLVNEQDPLPVHITSYYFTDRHRPVVHIERRDFAKPGSTGEVIADALASDAEAAFRKEGDGRGYVQELFIPWSLLGTKQRLYGNGNQFRLGIEAFWGDTTGQEFPELRFADLINPKHPKRSFFWRSPESWGILSLTQGGNEYAAPPHQLPNAEEVHRVRYSTAGPVAIHYELPSDAYATLVIERSDGTRIRNLIADYPRKAGSNTDYWDGMDDSGRLVEPGTYRVRGLYHESLDVRYEFSLGNPGNPPWPTADSSGGWLANHTNPMAVLADEERVYVSAAYSEGPHALIALDYDGNKIWGGLPDWYGGFMVRSGKYLYVVNHRDFRPARRSDELVDQARIELIRIDPRTGREVPFPSGKSRHTISTWNVQNEGQARAHDGATVANRAHNANWVGTQAQGLTAVDGVLYIAMHFADKLLKVDAGTGAMIGSIALPAPAGLASDGRRLLAISGSRVVEVDPENGRISVVVDEGLVAPVGLTVDTKGNIYASDWADQMCVKVFNARGRQQGTVGKPGGRPWQGAYDRQAMLLPRGISVDRLGRLWVAEDDFSPRRISVWAPDGSLVLEKIGDLLYGGQGAHIFPDRPDRGLVTGNLVEIDWQEGRWRLLGTPWRSTHPDALLGLKHDSRIGSVRSVNGRSYLLHSAGYGVGVTVISEIVDDQIQPVAAVGAVYAALPYSGQGWRGGVEPSPLFVDHLWNDGHMNAAARRIIPWFFKGPRSGDVRAAFSNSRNILRESGIHRMEGRPTPNNNFVWSDLNGNHRIESNEIYFHKTPNVDGHSLPTWGPERWSRGVADQELNLYLSAVHKGGSYHWKLPVSRWAKSGAPIYEPDEAQLVARSPYLGHAAWLDAEGSLLTYGNLGNPARQGLRDPLVMHRPDGRVAWTYPSDYTGVHGSHSAPKARRGLLLGPLGVLGDAELQDIGQIFAFHTNLGQVVLFTVDGLYIGSLFQDARAPAAVLQKLPVRGMSINRTSNGGEWFGGQFFQNVESGEVFVISGRRAGNIGRVEGLESIRRLPDRLIEFDRLQYAKASKSAQLPAQAAEKTAKLEVRPLRRIASKPPRLKDLDFDWDKAAVWSFDDHHKATAIWTWDRHNLHIAFRKVLDDSPMINNGEDPQQLFKSGDAALLELRTRADDDAGEVLKEDQRLLFSVFRGKPIAVLYRYRLAEASDPVVFRSVTSTRIDEVKILNNARISIDRRTDSYSLIASVPLEDIGFRPESGRNYRGDFGIIYSDRAGIKNVLRMNWANRATGLVDDLAGEAEIDPKQWGSFVTKFNTHIDTD